MIMSDFEILKLNTHIGNARFDMVLKEGYYLREGSEFPRLHCHPDYEIHCIEKGTCTYALEKGKLQLESPALVLFPPKSYHGFLSMSPDCEKCCFEFNLSQDGEGAAFFEYATLLSGFQKGKVFQIDFPSIMKFSRQVYSEEDRYRMSCGLGEILLLVLSEIRKSRKKKSKPVELSGRKTMEQTMILGSIIAHIEKNYQKDLTLKDISAAVHLSERQIERILKNGMQAGFLTILNRYRIRIAVQKIMDGETDMEKLSEQCGFQGYTSFWRHFKSYTGMPPRKYAAEMRNRRK